MLFMSNFKACLPFMFMLSKYILSFQARYQNLTGSAAIFVSAGAIFQAHDDNPYGESFFHLKQPHRKPKLLNHSNPNKPSLRIHPIGDSITAGAGEAIAENSYRRVLECSLHTQSYSNIHYIGTKSSGNWPDNKHSGFGGKKIHEISSLANNLVREGNANIALLFAGTNDVFGNYQLESAGQRLEHLIHKIQHFNPKAVIFLATITTFTNSTLAEMGAEYNAKLPDIVRRRREKGVKIRLVDMSAITTEDLASDGGHPSPKGYRKMASMWLEAIERAFREGIITDIEGIVDGGTGAVPESGNCDQLRA